MRYRYITSCATIRKEDVPHLEKMVDDAKSITYQTFRRHCRGPDLTEWVESHGYTRRGLGIHLKKDRCVSYYKSRFKGAPCYFLVWSAIDFIWVPENNLNCYACKVGDLHRVCHPETEVLHQTGKNVW